VDASAWNLALLGLAVFVVGSLGGMLVVGTLIVKLPVNHFHPDRPRELWMDRHPVVRWTGLLLKNLLGSTVVGLGLVLSMPGVPGPGLATILLGIMLLDFPGKHRLERWLLTRPAVAEAVNRLRGRYGRPPFDLGDT
jgi:hypothetical protein